MRESGSDEGWGFVPSVWERKQKVEPKQELTLDEQQERDLVEMAKVEDITIRKTETRAAEMRLRRIGSRLGIEEGSVAGADVVYNIGNDSWDLFALVEAFLREMDEALLKLDNPLLAAEGGSPREPTLEMIAAGRKQIVAYAYGLGFEDPDDAAADVYRAMVRARSDPPKRDD